MSVSERISGAVITVVTGLSLSPTPTIKPRKRAMFLDGETTSLAAPLIVVTVADRATDREQVGKGTWLVRYPASIAVVFPRGGLTGDNTTARSWLDAIWPALADWRSLIPAGVAEVNSTSPRSESLFDRAALAAQLDWGTVDLTVETFEQRYS